MKSCEANQKGSTKTAKASVKPMRSQSAKNIAGYMLTYGERLILSQRSARY